MESPNYEFSSAENTKITALVRYMSLFSWACMLAGPMLAMLSFYADVLLRVVLLETQTNLTPAFLVSFLVGVVVTVLGFWLRQSTRAFHQIVVTEGSDVSHLMRALDQLRLFFRYGGFLAWMVLATAALVVAFYVVRPARAQAVDPGPGAVVRSWPA